jgi:hypothetical protein
VELLELELEPAAWALEKCESGMNIWIIYDNSWDYDN